MYGNYPMYTGRTHETNSVRLSILWNLSVIIDYRLYPLIDWLGKKDEKISREPLVYVEKDKESCRILLKKGTLCI